MIGSSCKMMMMQCFIMDSLMIHFVMGKLIIVFHYGQHFVVDSLMIHFNFHYGQHFVMGRLVICFIMGSIWYGQADDMFHYGQHFVMGSLMIHFIMDSSLLWAGWWYVSLWAAFVFHYGQCFVMGRLMMQHMCLCGQADECHAAECVSRTKRCGANGPKCCSVCTGTVLWTLTGMDWSFMCLTMFCLLCDTSEGYKSFTFKLQPFGRYGCCLHLFHGWAWACMCSCCIACFKRSHCIVG